MEWIVIGVIAVVLLFVGVGIYNRLVALRQNVNQGVADIDAQLRQRHDLIPNLVETVKGYATHEKTTLDEVIEARNRAAQGGPNSGSEAQLRVALDKLLALGEAYPDLKASANFQEPPRAARSTPRSRATTRRARASRRCCSPARSVSRRPISTASTTARRAPSTRFRTYDFESLAIHRMRGAVRTIFTCSSSRPEYMRASCCPMGTSKTARQPC